MWFPNYVRHYVCACLRTSGTRVKHPDPGAGGYERANRGVLGGWEATGRACPEPPVTKGSGAEGNKTSAGGVP